MKTLFQHFDILVSNKSGLSRAREKRRSNIEACIKSLVRKLKKECDIRAYLDYTACNFKPMKNLPLCLFDQHFVCTLNITLMPFKSRSCPGYKYFYTDIQDEDLLGFINIANF